MGFQRLVAVVATATLLSITPAAQAAGPADDVLLAQDIDTSQLFRLRADGTGRVSLGLAPGEGQIGYAEPSGLAAVLRADWGVDVLDVTTGQRRTVLAGDELSSRGVSWDPTGQWLLATTESAGDTSVRLLSADGTVNRELFPGQWPGGSYGAIGWAPDGSAVVIQGWEGYPSEKVVRRVRTDGTERSMMPDLVLLAPQPGGTVAFGIEDYDTGARLVRFGADLTTRTVLRTMPGGGWSPVWSGDGSRVAVSTEPGVIRVLRPDGTQVAAMGDDNWESFGLRWDFPTLNHDGSVLLVHGDASSTANWQADGIYALDVGRGRSCQVTDIYTHSAADESLFAPDGSYALLGSWGGVKFRWRVAAGAKPVRVLSSRDTPLGWITRPGPQARTTPCPPIRDMLSKSLLVRRKKVDRGMRFRLERAWSYPQCRAGAVVKVHRRAGKRWVMKRTVTLNEQGRAEVVIRKKGTYRFRIAQRLVEPFLCTKATTRVHW